jgi:hypothetical protein
MIMDYNAQFDDGVSAILLPANTAATLTEYSSTVVDFMTANWNPGAGTPLWVIMSVGTTFSGAVSNPVYVKLYGGTTSLLAGATLMYQSRTFTIGECSKGAYLMAYALPAGTNVPRFMKTGMVLSGVSLTAGVFDTYLSLNAPRF